MEDGMRKLLYIMMMVLISIGGAGRLSAQVAFEDFKDSFQAFADDVAASLPFNSAIGLQWSDAYIGNFPHFGVGATIGTTFIPWDAVQEVADTFDIDFPSIYPGFVGTMGVPLPAWSLEARLGGFGLPFDMGVKVGYLPEEARVFLPEDMTFDYLLLGADFRYGLLEDGILPGLSIGVGVNYMAGRVTYTDKLGSSETINLPDGHNLSMSDPELVFEWRSLSIDLKAQLSKNLIFFTPFIGVAASYTVYAEAGGGLASDVQYDGHDIQDSEIESVKDTYGIDISETNISVMSSANGWGFRAFGGLAVNILIIKIDLLGMYNLLNGAIGFSVNARVQL
jgi:hypothetical protein